MPLFICSKCDSVENTALGDFWMRDAERQLVLCSACSPETKAWHGKFSRRVATAELRAEHGAEKFYFVAGGFDALPLFTEHLDTAPLFADRGAQP